MGLRYQEALPRYKKVKDYKKNCNEEVISGADQNRVREKKRAYRWRLECCREMSRVGWHY